ncbi:MAG: TIGR02206 family membrane protein [Acidobacteriota bacterium]|nr:TIGR02206 family membrane protein [Acidobacteriota bacterium]
MPLFAPLHLSLLAVIAAAAAALALVSRRRHAASRVLRLAIGWSLVVNELVWWAFRYSHEGLHLWNLPLQLCDVTLWTSALACLTLAPPLVEFAYFAGLAGAGMALLTPDLWSPWPSYPAIYFFLVHGGIVLAVSVLVFGRAAPLRPGAMTRAFAMLLAFAAAVGALNAVARTNFMYLCRKPKNASALDRMGPWPVYLLAGAAAAWLLFLLLWLPVRPPANASSRKTPR